AVGEDGADAGVPQGGDGGVAVGGGVFDVGPVDQGGDAGVESAPGAEQGAGVDVLGAVPGAVAAQQDVQVVGQRPGRAAVPEAGLPGVPVGVDQAGQHQHAGGVEDLGVRRDGQVGAGGRDAVAVDEEVGELVAVGGDEPAALDHGAHEFSF